MGGASTGDQRRCFILQIIGFTLKHNIEIEVRMADDIQEARRQVFGVARPRPGDIVKYLGLVRPRICTQ